MNLLASVSSFEKAFDEIRPSKNGKLKRMEYIALQKILVSEISALEPESIMETRKALLSGCHKPLKRHSRCYRNLKDQKEECPDAVSVSRGQPRPSQSTLTRDPYIFFRHHSPIPSIAPSTHLVPLLTLS